MPKRSREETEEDRWEKKKLKYERKLAKKKRRVIIYSSDEDRENVEGYPIHVVSEENVIEQNSEAVLENHDNFNNYSEDQIASTCDNVNTGQPCEDVAVPSSSTIDPFLLQALGDCHSETPIWGTDILQDISDRWQPILKDGLKKEVKDELFKGHLFPKNLHLSMPPKLNAEISSVITESCRARDGRLLNKQGQLGHALAAVGKAMTGILSKNIETTEVLKLLNDTGKLIADSHYTENESRRSLIMPLLDKSFISIFKDRRRDSMLFGENLGEFIKSSQGVKKTGQIITPPAQASLNWRGPPRQRQFRTQAQASRGGGQRAARPAQRAPPPPPRRPPLPASSRGRPQPPPPPPAASRYHRNRT